MKKILIFLLISTFAAQTVHAAVEAFEIGPGNTDQLPKGKEADGIIGDLILRNNKITAVISGNQPLRRAKDAGPRDKRPGQPFDHGLLIGRYFSSLRLAGRGGSQPLLLNLL